jgi:cytochrome c5
MSPIRIGRPVLAALVLALLARAVAGIAAAAVPAPPRYLAGGEGREIAGRACLMCHAATLITQQAKDSTGWEKTLAQMEKWGAPVTPAEHPKLHGYLWQHYGARTAR